MRLETLCWRTFDGHKIKNKLDTTNKKWDDHLAALEERERALEAIAGSTRDFLNQSSG
jgi:hypothetical protein